MSQVKMPRLAIIGAGPIGLEAGLYAQKAGIPFTIFERARIAEHLLRWGHIKLFSPFGMNTTPLGKQAVRQARHNFEFPEDGACITGRDHVANYLAPLAETMQARIMPETQVLHIGRRDLFKSEDPGDPKRAKSPFRLLVRDKKAERVEEADVVLDCTGTYGQHRWLGTGGIPALGEIAAEPNIAYGLDDILGDKRNQYASKNILVVGGGFSAATTVCSLAKLAEDAASTWVIWVARAGGSQPLKRITDDPLRERDRLAARANNFATRNDGNVEFHGQTVVEAVEFLGADKGFKVTTRSAGKNKTWEIDRVIANVGYTPDRGLYRELQIHECYATFGPMNLAAALQGQRAQDCLKQTSKGPDSLKSPEPNFYILGAKSYGRNSTFLLRTGFEQIREVFTLITGDPNLNLYKS